MLYLKRLSMLVFAFSVQKSLANDVNYDLIHSSIEYKVKYTLKNVTAKNDSAKGKGACTNGQCQFLVATPTKDFNSGDRNRDLHMQEVTKAALHPLIKLQLSVPQNLLNTDFKSNVDVEFAGIKKTIPNVLFKLKDKNQTIFVDFNFIILLSDFSIERPKLLTIPIDNEVPISITANWTRNIK